MKIQKKQWIFQKQYKKNKEDNGGVFAKMANILKHKEGRKAVYVAIGIRLSGQKEVLGMWIGGNESAKYWLGVLNEIKNRGVEDIMIVSVDGLTGFVDAIHAVFPLAEIQRCIVHQIRYSTKFISYKDIRAFMKDLKLVNKADTEQLTLEDRKSTRLNSSHSDRSRMPSSA